MTPIRHAKLLAAVLTPALTTAPFPAVASVQQVQTRDFTIFSVARVPISDVQVVRSLTGTITGTSDSFTINWTFNGISSGVGAATASGTGTGSWNGDTDTLTVTLTSISSWNIPGFPQPQVPKTATIQQVFKKFAVVSVSDPVQGTIVSGLPILVHDELSDPFETRGSRWIVPRWDPAVCVTRGSLVVGRGTTKPSSIVVTSGASAVASLGRGDLSRSR
jgi:hypothetical protein